MVDIEIQTHADRIGIHQFKGTVAVGRHKALGQSQCVVIGRLITQIQTHKGHCRRAVGQHLNIAGYKAEMLGVPGAGGLEISQLQHHMTEFHHLGRGDRRALGGIDALYLLRLIERQRLALRQRPVRVAVSASSAPRAAPGGRT